MKKISRHIYNYCIADANRRKALALLIFCKKHIKSSTVNNFSYNKLRKITGLHISTLKKRIQTLKEMELIQYVGKSKNHLMFKCVRANNSNVCIERISFNSIKDVEEGLLAMFIVEVQLRKDFANHLAAKKKNPKNLEEYKWALRKCKKYGLGDFFVDNGISYKYLANKLNIQLNKVSDVIKYALSQAMIFVNKRWKVEIRFNSQKEAIRYLSAYDCTTTGVFASKGVVYSVGANLYSIPSDWKAGLASY